MKLVVLETPYAGDVERNVAYARACMRNCLLRGEAPLTSHLLYTQPGVLRDDVSEERKHGIEADFALTHFRETKKSICKSYVKSITIALQCLRFL